MLIKFGGVRPKLFPDWLNGSATTTVHLSGTPGQMSRPERSATRVAAGGADTAGRFPSVVCMAWPLAEFSSFRPESEGARMWHDVLVEQITWAENVIRTIEDSGRQLASSRARAQGATAQRGFYVLTLSARVGLLIGARHQPGPRRSACRGWTAQWCIDRYPRHQLGWPISNVLAAECSRGR